MGDPRQGRAGAGGFSPRMGARDPRLRTNAAGQVGDQDLDPGTLERDGQGRTRLRAVDGMAPLAPHSTLSQVIAAHNALIARLKGG